jgi:hypothetical protein
MEHG